ncbi:MAG TPA: type II secretion system minor pseudopilin GspJ [Gammaproteobacteria bacterium]|jgi:general secretion pathway protein J|nr:type II secretion system minor pseudopilin GspJ [Gammaproteobacteria bacterium]
MPSTRSSIQSAGFTLIEILVALFIFTIVSIMLLSALKNVINVQSVTKAHGERLRELQMAMLLFSRELEQAVDRPVLGKSGTEEMSFVGTLHSMTFTHIGHAVSWPDSGLRRVRYWSDTSGLWRQTGIVIDVAPQSITHQRLLLQNITEVEFHYLDQWKQFHDHWPVSGNVIQPLPSAVSISFKVPHWGDFEGLYVVSA